LRRLIEQCFDVLDRFSRGKASLVNARLQTVFERDHQLDAF
jgi:hypothetical protein